MRSLPDLAPTCCSNSSVAPSKGPPTTPWLARNSSMIWALKSCGDVDMVLLVGWLGCVCAGAGQFDDVLGVALHALHRLAGAAAQIDHRVRVGDLERPPHRAVVLPALEVLDRDRRRPPAFDVI